MSDNSVTPVCGRGGGIYTEDGTLTVLSSTLSGSSAGALGGGIHNLGDFDSATLTILSSTLSGSSAGSGGGITNVGLLASTYARNTLLAGNTASGAPDLRGLLTSQGHNLIGDGSGGCGFDPTDLVGTASNPIDPKLGPLADNGGPTLTMALLPGSPAIDAGDNTDAPMWDQRGPGFDRIVNGIIDIGAFEVQADAHHPPISHSLPNAVTVPAMADGPLLGRPSDLPANLLPVPELGSSDEQTGQSEPTPVPTATGQPVATLDLGSANDSDALALNVLGGP